jgi:ubiquinone/menaquinone biosynthesis C-methylase UbiE
LRGPNPFETLAGEYDAWFDEHPALFESELQAMRAVLPERLGRWIEIGVGTGRFASRLGIGLGVEPAAAMADRARRRGLDVLDGTAERLPLADSSADALFFITTLCFVSDVGRALAEARRVLVPGGAIVVAFLPRDSELGQAVSANSSDPFYRAARLLSAQELLRAMADAGFAVDRVVQTLTSLARPETVEAPSDGCDRGSFVVVRGRRPQRERRSSMQS